MRQLIVKIARGHRDQVLKAVEHFGGKNSIVLPSEENEVFILFLPNEKINNFLEELDHLEKPEINLIPRGVLSLYPPASESPNQVADVQPKSSLEIYLSGIQSVGSLQGFLGYSLAAGIIVWIGLYTSTLYLLVAAMLVAPFAGPAMNAALATAAGKGSLLKSSLGRYGLAIFVGVFASLLMSMLFPVRTLTPLMIEISHVSKVAIFLPLIAGFAGAVNIVQSERDSLVSGAAVGILVAASLAPPVGLIGAGIYLVDWEVITTSIFRIILQLLGIHFSATLVFYFYGKVTPKGVRFLKGNKRVTLITSGLVILGMVGMMFWQFSQEPSLQKASLKTELTERLDTTLKSLQHVKIIKKNVYFTGTKINGLPIVNYELTVIAGDEVYSEMQLKEKIRSLIKKEISYMDDKIHEVYLIHIAEE